MTHVASIEEFPGVIVWIAQDAGDQMSTFRLEKQYMVCLKIKLCVYKQSRAIGMFLYYNSFSTNKQVGHLWILWFYIIYS